MLEEVRFHVLAVKCVEMWIEYRMAKAGPLWINTLTDMLHESRGSKPGFMITW